MSEQDRSVLKEVEALLQHLTRDELFRLRQRIKINLDNDLYSKGTPVDQAKAGEDEKKLLSAIIENLKGRAEEFPIYSLLASSAGMVSFRKKVPEVFEFLRQVECTDTELTYLVNYGVHLLYEDIKKRRDRSPSARNLMAEVHRIPAVYNLEFPGYAQAGLLHMIVRRR